MKKDDTVKLNFIYKLLFMNFIDKMLLVRFDRSKFQFWSYEREPWEEEKDKREVN